MVLILQSSRKCRLHSYRVLWYIFTMKLEEINIPSDPESGDSNHAVWETYLYGLSGLLTAQKKQDKV